MFLIAQKRDALVSPRQARRKQKTENHPKFSPVYMNKDKTLRLNTKEYDKQAKLF